MTYWRDVTWLRKVPTSERSGTSFMFWSKMSRRGNHQRFCLTTENPKVWSKRKKSESSENKCQYRLHKGVAKMAFWGKTSTSLSMRSVNPVAEVVICLTLSAGETWMFDSVSLFWKMAGSHIFAKAARLNQRCYSLFCCLVGGNETGFTFSWSPLLSTPTFSECGRPGLQGPGQKQ